MKQLIMETIQNIAAKVYPLIGKGEEVQNCIDDIAGKEICQMIKRFNKGGCKSEVLSVEGKRDGVDVSFICAKGNQNAKYYLLLDPIDGTLAASRGGSRCTTVIAIAEKKDIYLKIPDELSCFYVASNYSRNFVENFWRCIGKGEKISLNYYKNDIIGTLRRQESEEFWQRILGLASLDLVEGEKAFYYPNGKYEKIFFAGDSSIPLFFECEHFCGRTGVAEARIESRLWKYWKGIIVSGTKIKEYKGGLLQYLSDYLVAIQEKKMCLDNFFTEREIEELQQLGWTSEKVMSFFDAKGFSPEMKLVVIASLTGTIDKVFKEHSNNNLAPMKIKKDKQKIYMEYLLYEKGRVSLLNNTFSLTNTNNK